MRQQLRLVQNQSINKINRMSKPMKLEAIYAAEEAEYDFI